MTDLTRQLRSLVEDAEYLRNAYFWTPDPTAHGRRDFEKKHNHDEIAWTDGKDIFTAKYTVRCSCKNVYAWGEYTRNGKITTLTAVRNSLKRLEAKE